jgi:hypothetical protein
MTNQPRTIEQSTMIQNSRHAVPAVVAIDSDPRFQERGFYFGYFWFSYFPTVSPSCDAQGPAVT